MWTQQRDNATTRPGKISDKKDYIHIYIYKFEIEIDSENQQRPAQQQKQKAQKKNTRNLSVAYRNYEN